MLVGVGDLIHYSKCCGFQDFVGIGDLETPAVTFKPRHPGFGPGMRKDSDVDLYTFTSPRDSQDDGPNMETQEDK